MNAKVAALPAQPVPDGKRRLIKAALRLAAKQGTGLSSLGLRELAREANLNHNTFYRHFDHIDELGRAAAEEVVPQLMAAMKEIRRNAASHKDANVGATEHFLDFAQAHPDLIVVGLRELHSSDSPMRATLKQALAQIAEDSADQMLELQLGGSMSRDTLVEAASAITYYMFYRALDVIEQPRERRRVRDEIVAFIRSQFLGRHELQRATRK